MSGRASHEFIKRKCETNSCCNIRDGFSSNDPDINTNVNVIRTRTRASCCFPVPIPICDFYGGTGCTGDTTPTAGVFATSPDHPSVTSTPPIPLSALNDGLVFRIESFITTDRGGFRDFGLLPDSDPVLGGDAQQNVEEPFNVVILRRDASASSPLISNHPNSFIIDTPMETLNGSFALGSLDYVFKKIFESFDGLHHPIQVGASLGNKNGFISLTNPNEMGYGTTNVIQIE